MTYGRVSPGREAGGTWGKHLGVTQPGTPQMTEPKHVVVVGAGIVGVSTALWLQRGGHRVSIVDREGPAAGASYGNGGVLASCSIVPVTVPGLLRKAPRMLFDPNQPLFLKWGYLPRLAPWLLRYLRHANARDATRIAEAVHKVVGDSLEEHQALATGTPAERYLKPCDYVFLYRDRAHYEGDAFGWGLRRAAGLKWDELEGRDLAAYDPVWGTDNRFAARFGNHGRISDPGAYVTALAEHVVAQGGRLIKGAATDFALTDGRVCGVQLDRSETLSCDAVVVAAGVWSGKLAEKLGLKVPLETERGYHLELWEPSVMPRAAVMVAAGKFVATPMDGRLRLAGIVEFGGLEAKPTRAAYELLQRQIKLAIPGISWKSVTEWMGHRPAPVDSIPAIGAVPGLSGVFAGFGHHHIGLTAGPRTGRLLAQLISGQMPNIDLATFTLSRFR